MLGILFWFYTKEIGSYPWFVDDQTKENLVFPSYKALNAKVKQREKTKSRELRSSFHYLTCITNTLHFKHKIQDFLLH